MEDVDRGGSDLAGVERVDQRVVVDQLAARGVHDPHAVLHLRDRRGVDHAARLGVRRQVQRQEIGALEHPVEGVALDAELLEALGGDERVVGEHAHLEADRAPRDLLADPAEAEHAERLLGELDAAPLRALPAALLERGMRLRNVACEGNEQADRVLGRRDDVRLGRVGDDDSATRRRVDVDVVDPHSRAADHLQVRGLPDQLGGQLRRRANDDRVVAVDDRREVALTVDVDVELGAQQVDTGRRDLFSNQDLHRNNGTRLPPLLIGHAVEADAKIPPILQKMKPQDCRKGSGTKGVIAQDFTF